MDPLSPADYARLSTADLISLLWRRGWPVAQRKNAGLLTEAYRGPIQGCTKPATSNRS